MKMSKKKLYIKTMGCQMNVYDSQSMARVLAPLGYELTDVRSQADCLLLNTCAIREKAEQKVFSYLGRLVGMKANNPDLIIGVGGCVAQQEAQNIIGRMPHVDLVFGTHAVNRLPDLVRRIQGGDSRIVDVGIVSSFEEIQAPSVKPASPASPDPTAFVTIMAGCDNFCTYCVVPHVRGREMSRTSQAICEEVRELASKGVREVTLLGQNVNSYGAKEGLESFTQLLIKVHEIEGIDRIRFTTSHPKDLSDELIRAFAELPKLCKHIHLPVQSGSDRILKKMNRGYTRREYLNKVKALRSVCPEITLTSDIIVGFPSETDEDFEQTMELIREADYDSLFAFIYSDRPSAPARKFPDKVELEVKSRRLAKVLELSESMTRKKHKAMVGSVFPVLVEGVSKNDPEQWRGRTSGHVTVNFTAPASSNLTGRLVDVKVEKGFSHSIWGKIAGGGKCEPQNTEVSHAA